MAENIGKLLLRLSVAIILLLHGIHKMRHGNDFVTSVVTGAGLPAFFAYGVYIGEVLAPLALIVGLYSRIAALIIAINMLATVIFAHRDMVFSLNAAGGWAIEFNVILFMAAISCALIGPGIFSLQPKR